MMNTNKFARIEITSVDQLRDWLLEHHPQSESVWLVTFMKSEGEKYVSRREVLDELICFGWIDGVRKKLDGTRTMQLISPRRVQHWAKSYKDRAAKLIAEGRMHESGIKSIEVSKANGLWDFLDDVDKLIIPGDLEAALKENSEAYEFFVSINDSSKRNALRWLKLAKADRTRQNRIKKLTELSLRGEKLPGS